ncbi:hypothetical protein Tco_0178652 [Tanacetum coccineum]
MYDTRQTMISFPSRLNGCCYEEKKRSYGPQFLEAYSEASHINNSIPKKDEVPGSFILPCFINNVCFDNALVDLGASVSVMPLLTYLNLGLGELTHTKLTVELADRTVKYPKGIVENVLVGIGKFAFPVSVLRGELPNFGRFSKKDVLSTRPDLAHAISRLSRYTSNPSDAHWKAMTRVLHYLRYNQDFGLHYDRYPAVIEGYNDTNWISDIKDSKSTSGYVFTLGGPAIS